MARRSTNFEDVRNPFVAELLSVKGNKIILNEEIFSTILMQDKCRHLPAIVVSVTGFKRCGKSFLLNEISKHFYTKSGVSFVGG